MVKAQLEKESIQEVQRKGEADLPTEVRKRLEAFIGADKAYMGAAFSALEAICQNYGYNPSHLVVKYYDTIAARQASEDPDTKPREPLCQCHWEESDSPCPTHKSPDDEELDTIQDQLDYEDPRDDPDRAI